MSGNDQMKWDDNLDFESLADEYEGTLPEEANSSGDLQDLAYDQPDTVEPAAGDSELEETASVEGAAAEKTKAPRRVRRSRGISALGMGMLFGFATLTAAAGLAGAVLLLAGMTPRQLWNPEALMSLEPWLNLQSHPLHVFYLVAIGIVALTWLISWRVLAYSRSVNRNLRETENLLARVADLRLDNEAAWQNAAFKTDASVEAFVVETLGAWRLQVARQDKNLALEGELRRLESAAANGSRGDLAANFEHPLVGTVADHMRKLFDAKVAAEQEVEAVRSKDTNESGSIVGVIQDARSWNRHTLDQLSVQAASVVRIAGVLEESAAVSSAQRPGAEQLSQVSLALRELKSEIESLAAVETRAHTPGARSVADQLTELTERGGKLAFQIAMEVASLGERGERLLPMAQALEELTTEFRESAGRIQDDKKQMPRYPEMVRKLDGLIGMLDSMPAHQPSPLEARANDLNQLARRTASDLELLAGSFNHQAERLTELGVSFSALTGASFDAGDLQAGRADNPPAGSLNISQMDPFAAPSNEPESSHEIDPFATADSVLQVGQQEAHDPDFSGDVTPSVESAGFVEQAEAPTFEPAPGPMDLEIESPAQAALSAEEERVYDLAEFGAQRVDDEPTAGAEDRIYDLAEFGAVPLG